MNRMILVLAMLAATIATGAVARAQAPGPLSDAHGS